MDKRSIRYSLLFVITIMIMFVYGCGATNQNLMDDTTTEARSLKDSTTFDTVVQQLDTPQKVYDWMSTNITYQQDTLPSDEFRDPKKTFELGYGDCDDYAMFANYVLQKHGYKTKVISVYTDEQGHCVCVWEDTNKKLDQLSNTGVVLANAKDLNEVADSVYANWKVYSVYPDNSAIMRPAGR